MESGRIIISNPYYQHSKLLYFLLYSAAAACNRLQNSNPNGRFITAAQTIITYASTCIHSLQPCLLAVALHLTIWHCFLHIDNIELFICTALLPPHCAPTSSSSLSLSPSYCLSFSHIYIIYALYSANIINKPDEEKFKRINLNNAAFQSKVYQVVGGEEVMAAIGMANFPYYAVTILLLYSPFLFLFLFLLFMTSNITHPTMSFTP